MIGGLSNGNAKTSSRTMAALDDQTFAACMAVLEPFEDAPFLAIAVSGGADSLALTLLANRWARQRGGHVVGLTVRQEGERKAIGTPGDRDC